MITESIIVDLHETFMEFKLDVGEHMTELHPSEVVASCTKLFGYMVAGAVQNNGIVPTFGGHTEGADEINLKIEKYYPMVRQAIEDWEIPIQLDRIRVNADIPARTLINVSHRPVPDWNNRLVDQIIDDIASGVIYPKHIRSMIEEEYPNAIENKLREDL
jgi:hypothetical protein